MPLAVEAGGVRPRRAAALRAPRPHGPGPRHQHRDKLEQEWDHHKWAICHYVVFPNTVFNCNPEHIQVFNPIPIEDGANNFGGSTINTYAQAGLGVLRTLLEPPYLAEDPAHQGLLALTTWQGGPGPGRHIRGPSLRPASR